MEVTQHMSLKAAKEAFVAGLSGTSKLEIFAIVATLSLSIVICEHAKMKIRPGTGLVLEMLLIIYPQLLICTGALPLWPTLSAFALVAAACYLWDACHPGRAQRHELPGVDDLGGPRKSYVGMFRGALMAATCICILAVDFRAFPRRYAKAEAYGTGYMDVGVGGVVLTAGLVSPATRLGSPPDGGSGDAAREGGGARRWRSPPLWRRLWSGLRGAAACWLLGLVRLLTTRAVDYQEHVGEYGVHWNFFHTVAVVALLGQAVVLPPDLLAPAAIAVTAGHQAALTLGGLGPWVMSPERGSDLLSLNKEGLVSGVGFWALYLWGAAMAHVLHVTVQPAVQHLRVTKAGAAPQGGAAAAGGGGGATAASAAPLVRWWAQLVALDGLLWVAVAVLEARVEPISRRSCNAAYIMWIAAQCLAGMLPLALWQALATAAAADAAAEASPRGASSGSGGGDAGTSTKIGPNVGGRFEVRRGEVVTSSRQADGGGGSGSAGGAVGDSGGDGSRESAAPGALPQREKPSAEGAAAAAAAAAAAVGAGRRPPRVRGPGAAGPRVLQAINSNQLAIFLAANLLTGAVNMTTDTLQVADWPARALLAAYITCVCGLALLLDARGWRIKL